MTEYIYDTSRVETRPEQGFTGEEIIRCRDCEFCKPNKGKLKKEFPMWCEFIELDMGDADAFCAWGERKANERVHHHY